MFKYFTSLVIHKHFLKVFGENQNVKRFCCQSLRVVSKNNCKSAVFIPFFREVFPPRKVLKNKPVILLSSILTFLGLKEKTPEEKDSELILTIKRGILLMQRGEYDKAEQMLHLALKLAQEYQDEDGITYVYDTLANLAFETDQHEKAEKLFVNVLQRLLMKGEKEDSKKVVHISLKLAKIFEKTKSYQKAEQGYKFCIDTLNKKLQVSNENENKDEDTLALWGMSMDWYGRFLLDTNRKNEALDCFKKAYEMCVQVNGIEHEQTVVLLNDLGTVSSLIGDTESAMTYFKEARDIGNQLPEMKDLATIYINLGQLYFSKEMYHESKINCEEGLKKAQNYDDPVASSEAQQCLENISKVLKSSETSKNLKNVGKVLVN